ncbi:hypothetical protein B0J17DRAFT_626353 [Rhizoctonia solani]|nr:hypothetical protein B0J17DRAFT_626353 [Rhizoctonia solani]
MSESSLALEAKATLFKVTVFSIILVLSLTFLTGNLILSLFVLWGVCALVFGVMVFSLVWRPRISTLATQYDVGDFEAARLLSDPVLSNPTHKNVKPQPFTRSTTCGLNDTPVHCTPLEMLNKMSSETDASDGHSVHVQTTFATVAEGFENDCTFATSPFTSPPMYTMEIFVSKETVVYEDVVSFVPSGTPSPLILNQDLPDVTTPSLTELIKCCEAAIMESSMRDVELL